MNELRIRHMTHTLHRGYYIFARIALPVSVARLPLRDCTLTGLRSNTARHVFTTTPRPPLIDSAVARKFAFIVAS